MSDHADTVREFMSLDQRADAESGAVDNWEVALAALDALVAERDEARREVERLTEPFVARDQLPAAFTLMKARAEAAEAENARLREALACYADHRHWGIMRDDGFRFPSAVWIGPGSDSPVPDAPGVARAALAETEAKP